MSRKPKAPEKIGRFTRYVKRPSSMKYGFLYEARFSVPFAGTPRKVHVWLPGSYDFASPKKHPVIYMADGQNLVDKYLTAFGDWHLDRVVKTLAEEGYPEPILVGLDSPRKGKKRANELNPPYLPDNIPLEAIDKPVADVLLDFLLSKIKPLVESLFGVDTRKEATAIGGSSMGGIFSFYGYLRHPGVFGYAHSFSIPFFFYKKETLLRILDEWDPRPEKNGKLYIFVGGTGFEKKFKEGCFFVYEELCRRGFGPDQIVLDHQKEAIHNEECWYEHSFPAFRFWLKDL